MNDAEAADSASSQEPDVDHLFPGYTDVEQVGAGGFARVYKATSTQFRRVEAIKVLNMALSDDRDLSRFESECALLGQLEHPSIVDVHQAGESAHGEPFLAMAYAAKGSLDDRLKKGETFSAREVLRIAIKLCGALQTAHGVGVVHRDIKPSNVLLNQYSQPKLADFGVARLVTESSAELSIALTPAYAAPEQFRRPANTPDGVDVVTRATDVFSLASTIWALLLGTSPFGGRNDPFLDVAERVTSGEPASLDRDDLPNGLEEALLGALAKDPMARPTASALGRRLQQIERDAGFPATELVFVKDTSGAPMLSEIELPVDDDGAAEADAAGDDDSSDVASANSGRPEVKASSPEPPPVRKSPPIENAEATIRPPASGPNPLPRRNPTAKSEVKRPAPPKQVAAVRSTTQPSTTPSDKVAAAGPTVKTRSVDLVADAAEEPQRRLLRMLVPAALLLVLVGAGWFLNDRESGPRLDALGTAEAEGSSTTLVADGAAITSTAPNATASPPLSKPQRSEPTVADASDQSAEDDDTAAIVTTSTSVVVSVSTTSPSSTEPPTTVAPATTAAPTTTIAPTTTTTARPTTTIRPTTTARPTTTVRPTTTTAAPTTTTTAPPTTTTTAAPTTTTTAAPTTTLPSGIVPPQPTNVRMEVFDHQTIDIYWDHVGTDLTETILSLGCCGGVLGDQRYAANVRSARIAGLEPNQTYVANIIAVGPTGADGTKSSAAPVRVEAATTAALPPAPITNAQTAAGPNWIEVTWDHNDDRLDEFVVTVGCCGGVLTERRLAPTVRSYRFEGLQPGVDHVIDIQALGTPDTAGVRLGSAVTRAPTIQPE